MALNSRFKRQRARMTIAHVSAPPPTTISSTSSTSGGGASSDTAAINGPDGRVNERRGQKGSAVERVTSVTSRVSWEPGMKRLRTTPRESPGRPKGSLGKTASERGGLCAGWQELKESGCVWNSGSRVSPHIPRYSPNNQVCHEPAQQPPFWIPLATKRRPTAPRRTLASESWPMSYLKELRNYKELLYLNASHGVEHIPTEEITSRRRVLAKSEY